MRDRHAPARTARGFTLVELMVVLAVTLVGFMALLSLQKGVIQGNTNAWNTVGANHLAQHILETIRLEALQWYNDSGAGVGGYGQGDFRYLNALPPPVAGATSGWLAARFGDPNAAFQMQNQVPPEPRRGIEANAWNDGVTSEIQAGRQQRYCVRYRMTWLVPNVLARAEVRVLWERPERASGAAAQNYDNCPFPLMDNHPEDVYSLTLPMTVMRNVFVTQ